MDDERKKMQDVITRTIKEFETKAKDYPNRAGAYKIAIDYLKAQIAALQSCVDCLQTLSE